MFSELDTFFLQLFLNDIGKNTRQFTMDVLIDSLKLVCKYCLIQGNTKELYIRLKDIKSKKLLKAVSFWISYFDIKDNHKRRKYMTKWLKEDYEEGNRIKRAVKYGERS